MAVQFPPLRPTNRRFRPGIVPQTVARAVNGRTVRRPLANRQGGAEVELTYQNITDADVEVLRQARKAARGPYEPLTLPPEVWAGDPDLEAFVAFMPQDTAWRFSGEIEVQWSERGRATVTVRLRNYSRSVFEALPPPEIEVPPRPPLTYELIISETTGLASIDRNNSNYIMSQTIITSAGSVYWVGRETKNSISHIWINKYDIDGNQLWGRWLDGTTYPASTFDIEPVICEGPADGVFIAARGSGQFIRYFLVSAEGSLVNVKSWRYGDQAGFPGSPRYSESQPIAIHYEPSQNTLYMVGANHSLTVMRALTLDNAYGLARNPNNSQTAYQGRWFWLPDKQRILAVGWHHPGEIYDEGAWIREFSPDLRTQYQAYVITGALGDSFAVDSFGAVYSAQVFNSGPSKSLFYLTKLAGSDAGYQPLWTRTIPINEPPSASFSTKFGTTIDILPDGRIVCTCKTGNADNVPDRGRMHIWTLAPDASKTISYTILRFGNGSNATSFLGGPRVERNKEKITFAMPEFSLVFTSLDLPATETSLPVVTTVANNNTVKASTSYLPVSLSDVLPLPSRIAWTQPPTDLNPMVQGAEESWSVSDLTATIGMQRLSTGPLTVPAQIPAPAVRDTLIDLQFEGPNLSTTFVDSSSYNRTLTLINGNGGPWISTAQFMPGGTSSLRCNGAAGGSGRISCGVSSDYTPGLGDFDMICDVYIEGPWGIFSLPALTGGVELRVFVSNDGTIGDGYGISAPYTANQWTRIRYARFQQETRLIVGANQYRAGSAHNFNGDNLIVGYGVTLPFRGYIDNFRYTAGGILEPWPT